MNPLEAAYSERLGTVHLLFARYDEAEKLLRSLLASGPATPVLHVALADMLGRTGRWTEAVGELERALDMVGGRIVAFLGVAGAFYAVKGDHEKACGILAELQDHARDGVVSEFWLALGHAGLGDKDEAFLRLRRAVENRDSNLLYLSVAPRALGLHDDPRFGEILRSIGLSHLTALL